MSRKKKISEKLLKIYISSSESPLLLDENEIGDVTQQGAQKYQKRYKKVE